MRIQWPDIELKDQSSTKGTIVLLHGLGASSWLLALLARRLRQQGYRVENWGYYSARQSLELLIPQFQTRFEELHQSIANDEGQLHIVAHSLGSIITRAVLTEIELPRLQRVVMLSPPNRGSHFATKVGPYLRWWTPLVDELSDREDSFVNRLQVKMPANLELGIIAAEWDYVLTEMTTHLECEVDHITMPSRHTGLVLRQSAARQILHFLEHGRFHHQPCQICESGSMPEFVTKIATGLANELATELATEGHENINVIKGS
ncbi:esterase/lipase family protein [Planctomicrobium sp. SH527]|uniref:esterase/lipase family protein n=1 Tax=Planctomicrobium sp. SH527 TaxID=3448123 RepID=UPI003F5C4955